MDIPTLTSDEQHIGVIKSVLPDCADDNCVSVNQYDGNGGRITFGIFLGKNTWAECELLPEDAAKVVALILSKPSVAAILSPSEGKGNA